MGCFPLFRYRKKKYSSNATSAQHSMNESTSSHEQSQKPPLKSAPPSFSHRTRNGQSTDSEHKLSNGRMRTLSAPSSLEDQDVFSPVGFDDQVVQCREERLQERRFSNPLPLPRPSPEDHFALRKHKSFKISIAGSPSPIVSPGPLPLPPAVQSGPRKFSYDEVSTACQNFSADSCISESISTTTYKATFRAECIGEKLEAAVVRFAPSHQVISEFVSELNTLSALRHANICKLVGYYADRCSNGWMLLYEWLHHGTLDGLLHGTTCIDWSTRLKIALCAARGLAFLHDEGPFKAMFSDFSTSNIQIDKDFSAKICGFGCVSYNCKAEVSNISSHAANFSVDPAEKGLPSPKSIVWSFGIVLLELITGRKNLDTRYPKEEQNIVKWSRPYLSDDCRLTLIMDPRLKGRFPIKAARTVADMIVRCLHKDPTERPTMRTIVDCLANVQDMRHPRGYPLHEPSAIRGKVMLKSLSLNNITPPPRPSSFLHSQPPEYHQPQVSRVMPMLIITPS